MLMFTLVSFYNKMVRGEMYYKEEGGGWWVEGCCNTTRACLPHCTLSLPVILLWLHSCVLLFLFSLSLCASRNAVQI